MILLTAVYAVMMPVKKFAKNLKINAQVCV